MHQAVILPEAKHDLSQLDRSVARRVLDRVERLAEQGENGPHQALSGDWSGFFKLRVGDYRVLYRLIHGRNLLVVHRVRHRREVYRE